MKNILVMDDDEASRQTTAAMLRKNGHEIPETAGPQSAFEHVHQCLSSSGDGRSNPVGTNAPDRVTAIQNLIIESSILGIAFVQDRSIIWANTRLAELFGLPIEKIQGASTRIVYPSDEDYEAFGKMAYPAMEAGGCLDIPVHLKRTDGSPFWCRFIGKPIDPAAPNAGSIWLLEDITQRREAEEQLRLQTSALEAAANGIVITSRAGHILWVNPAFERMTGYTADEAIGKTPAILKSGRHDPEHYRNLWKTVLNGEVWQGELINRRKDGSLFHEEMTITPVRDEQGEVRNFIAIKQDITQRKNFERALAWEQEELQAQKESFRTLADNVPDAVARLDHEFRFIYGNRALAIEIGLDPSVFIGKTVAELGLVHMAMFRKELTQVFETGKTRTFEFQFPGPTGVNYREARLVPEFSAKGEVEHVLVLTRNVTEQKMAENARRMMEMQLRQAQKLEAIGQLAAGIAHEINTPTQYVGDNTRFLQDAFRSISAVLKNHGELLAAATQGAVPPELIEKAGAVLAASDLEYLRDQIPAAIAETLDGVDRITKIVRAMKEFSHPGSREKVAADLNKAIYSTITVARNEWKYVADLEVDLAGDLPLVPCFIGEFNQCILNLIINAAHAIADAAKLNQGAKGLITICTRQDGDFAEVRVTDTGTGIAEIHRPHIFEPFFTTKDVGRGTGQGLAMIYNIITQKHGGTVAFETETGRGTTFILRLPISPKPMAPQAAEHPAAQPARETAGS